MQQSKEELLGLFAQSDIRYLDANHKAHFYGAKLTIVQKIDGQSYDLHVAITGNIGIWLIINRDFDFVYSFIESSAFNNDIVFTPNKR